MLGADLLMRLFRSVFREQKTRLQVDWLTHTDEQIMEYLATVDEAAPTTIATELDRSVEYVSDRCRQLGLRGLLVEIDNERADLTYRLADLGRQYLEGEIGAEALEDLDESSPADGD